MFIVIQREDGGLSIMQDVPDEQMERHIAEWNFHQRQGERYVSHSRVEANDLPADRTFRDAWTVVSGRVEHDMTKCKTIAHDRRRAAREAEFAPLDDALAKRIPGTDEAAIEAQREAVRVKYADMQSAIDAAQTVAQIKAALL